jgi:hypothetical protein
MELRLLQGSAGSHFRFARYSLTERRGAMSIARTVVSAA